MKKSTDSGASWATVDDFHTLPPTRVGPGALHVDAQGTVFVAGHLGEQVSPPVCCVDHWLVRRSTDGGETWTTIDDFQLAPNESAKPHDVVTDTAGNLYVTGRAFTAEGSSRWIIRKLPVDTPRSPFRRGDCDGRVEGQITDAFYLLNYNFRGGQRPPCLAACDANGDGRVEGEVTDAIYLLTWNFRGGPGPVAPYPECGPGTEQDEALGCVTAPEICR